MSIGFTFSAISKNEPQEMTSLETCAQSTLGMFEEVYFEGNHRVFRIELCPGGEMFLNFRENTIYCDCQTNIAGPGFHQFAIEFLESFASQNELEFAFEDETEFVEHRDFTQLQEKHFYQWFQRLFTILSEKIKSEAATDWMISWPLDTFTPKSIPETVITPMGRYIPDQILKRIESEGIATVAADYFVWPHQEKDAYFYRNSALYLLWSHCYFMPSDRSEQDTRINGRIIDFLEQSVKHDPSLPFPKKEYTELCRLHHKEGIQVDVLPEYTLFDSIGYRRDEIKQVVGNLLIPLPGYDILENGNNSSYVLYDGLKDNWHTIHLTALTLQEMPEGFNPTLFENAVEEPIQLSDKNIKIQAAFCGRTESKDEEPYFSVFAEIHSDNQLSLLTLVFQRETEKEWAFSLLKSICVRQTEG